MIKHCLILWISLFSFDLIAQQDSLVTYTNRICYENGSYKTLEGIGEVRIVLKDGSSKVRCMLKEIKPLSIVYLKERVLHDMMIDKIKHIRIEDTGELILFDEKNKPFIKR